MPPTEMVRGSFDETLVHPLAIISVFLLVLFVLFSNRGGSVLAEEAHGQLEWGLPGASF